MRRISWPALTFLLITLLVTYINDQPVFSSSYAIIAWIGAVLITNIIWQILAYLSCWVFVLRQEKEQNYVWANYIIWTIVANLGIVSEILNRH